MTDCNCSCSTFGPGPHDPEARHPNPKACEHAETATSCDHPDSVFDRSICAIDDWMHTYCSACGAVLDGECAAPAARVIGYFTVERSE